jgi:hypothetical protein
MMSLEPEIVWLFEYRTYAYLVRRDAFTSLVRFSQDGNDYEVEVLNDDYEFFEEHSIDFEQD